MQQQKYEFLSEAKQVLDLMVHSVYSNPDIFLRELISNASDAIDKLRLESLSDDSLAEFAKDGRITVTADEEERTLTVSDNGIGMSREELVSYLGTIARSGTKEFISALQDAAASGNADLIGQFGIGFYSSFIVADRVTVTTKRAGAEEAWLWDSSGDGSYTIEPSERSAPGSDVTLYLKEKTSDDNDYLKSWVLRRIIRQYSDFVSVPIYLEAGEKEEEEKEPVNSMKALWTRRESDVTDEEYDEFYRYTTHDWEKPLSRIVYKAEGTNEFHALLYIPSRPPMDLFYRDGSHGVKLYIRRVFIMDDCRELIPGYLRFIKGVVDSEDLSLNISREILQKDRHTTMIKNGITRKVLDALVRMKRDKPEDYSKFWEMFGIVLKEGIISDGRDKEQILKLCLFDSSGGAKTTIEDYRAAMKDGQKQIYYLAGSSAEALAVSPKLEAFRKRGIEVLLLGDPVDEIWAGSGQSFDGCQFVSISAEEVEIPGETTEEERAQAKEMEETGFTARLKGALSELVDDVKISSRLVDSPATLVQKGTPISPQMRSLFRSMGQEMPENKRVLELNPSHSLIKRIAAESESWTDERSSDWGRVLMGLALISDGDPVENGRDFTDTISRLLGGQSGL